MAPEPVSWYYQPSKGDKMFTVGDLVKVEEKSLPFLGIPAEEVGGLLVVNDVVVDNHWAGSKLYEVRNSDGDYFGLRGHSLVAV
jgi:hypothetical protein